MNLSPSFPPQHCPLCGQPNQCAMEIARSTGAEPGPCWCARTTFSAELLNQIPEAARGVACLCAACVKASES
ncbi:MAG: cysteine-rich CWC family protein [Comamonadaceae bacterium]|nr:cysteine-rich CWC family protein [Comamonadaceae bacterium]